MNMVSTVLDQPFNVNLNICYFVLRLLEDFDFPFYRQWYSVSMPVTGDCFSPIISTNAVQKKRIISNFSFYIMNNEFLFNNSRAKQGKESQSTSVKFLPWWENAVQQRISHMEIKNLLCLNKF